jgi:hypothetical protein
MEEGERWQLAIAPQQGANRGACRPTDHFPGAKNGAESSRAVAPVGSTRMRTG